MNQLWITNIDDWTVWLRAAERAESTIQLRRYHVTTFAAQVGVDRPDLVTEDQVVHYLGSPAWSSATRRSHRSSIAQFYTWALTHERVDTDPTRGLLPMRPHHSVPRPAPDDVILESLHRSSPRVRLMLLLASEAGLRRAEIARVHREDLIGPDGTSLCVHGKGSRQRVVPLSDRIRMELRAYPETTWLFPSTAQPGPIGAIRVGELVSQALPDPWTCHSLRHRFATVTYARCHNLLLIQQLMGHSRPETTAGYIQLDLTGARDVVRNGSLAA